MYNIILYSTRIMRCGKHERKESKERTTAMTKKGCASARKQNYNII